MAVEIERKFLASRAAVPAGRRGVRIRQIYLPLKQGSVMRVRLAGPRAWLAVKRQPHGCSRIEIETPIPAVLARELFRSLKGSAPVVKRRYRRRYRGRVWEIDVFEGNNRGLIVAEVELKRADEPVTPPPWVGAEVTGDRRFANVALAARPFSRWSVAERMAVRRARC